ncbi:hypothetical protein EJB05_12129 [Eragrostis curvula]|uniref:Uncharacterized protein n=1 Tax=Eragrostis curvula TaxID=38414 RepID=A0A5J9VTJ1_9POAL|nr:hypothetical protein EJB05_12129 [Eragrostis curvula]
MDSRFCAISQFGKHPKFRKEMDIKELSKTLKSWPSLYYDISYCRYVLLPYTVAGLYTLFVIDHEEKTVKVFDPKPIDDCWIHRPCKRYFRKIENISSNYFQARRKAGCQHGFEDLFVWKDDDIEETPSVDSILSGDVVLQLMYTFNGTREAKLMYKDGRTMRRRLLVDMLTYEGNANQDIIPEKIRRYLRMIKEKSAPKI